MNELNYTVTTASSNASSNYAVTSSHTRSARLKDCPVRYLLPSNSCAFTAVELVVATSRQMLPYLIGTSKFHIGEILYDSIS